MEPGGRHHTSSRGGAVLGSVAFAVCMVSLAAMMLTGGRNGPLGLRFESCVALGVIAAVCTLVQPTVSTSRPFVGLFAASFAFSALSLTLMPAMPPLPGQPSDAFRKLTGIAMTIVQLSSIVLFGAAALVVMFRSSSEGKSVPLARRLYVAGGLILIALALAQAAFYFGGPSGLEETVRNAAYYPTILTLGALSILLGVVYPNGRAAVAWLVLPVTYLVGTCLTAEAFWQGRSATTMLGVTLLAPPIAIGLVPLLWRDNPASAR